MAVVLTIERTQKLLYLPPRIQILKGCFFFFGTKSGYCIQVQVSCLLTSSTSLFCNRGPNSFCIWFLEALYLLSPPMSPWIHTQVYWYQQESSRPSSHFLLDSLSCSDRHRRQAGYDPQAYAANRCQFLFIPELPQSPVVLLGPPTLG